MFRKFFLFLIVLLALFIAGLWFAPGLIPADAYKGQAIAKLQELTGRDIRIDGPISLRFLPSLELSLHDVHISNPKNFPKKPASEFTSLEALHLSLAILPLTRGQLVTDRLELVKPMIYLTRDANGKPNWLLGKVEPESRNHQKKKAETIKAPVFTDIMLPNIVISEGTLVYRASPKADATLFGNVNANAQLPSLNETFAIKAEAVHVGMPITLDMQATTLASFFHQQPAKVDLNAGFGDQNATIAADIIWKKDSAKFDALTLKWADLTLSGNVRMKMGKRIQVGADLVSAQAINLASLGTPETTEEAAPAAPPAKKATKVKKPEKANGWSDEPILPSLTFLRHFDMGLTLKTPGFKADWLELGEHTLRAILKDGNLTVKIPEVAFYGGSASVQFGLNAKRSVPILTENIRLRGVDMEPFLKDTHDFDRLSGKAELRGAWQTRGFSERDFVENLNGEAEFVITEGAMKGFDLGKLVQDAHALADIAAGKFNATALATGDEPKTAFDKLSGNITIAAGVVYNNDLALHAPLLHATGTGVVNVPEKTVDYRLEPSLLIVKKGEEATLDSPSISIPVQISGTFDNLAVRPDTTSIAKKILKDPKGALKDAKKNLKGLEKNVKELIKGL